METTCSHRLGFDYLDHLLTRPHCLVSSLFSSTHLKLVLFLLFVTIILSSPSTEAQKVSHIQAILTPSTPTSPSPLPSPLSSPLISFWEPDHDDDDDDIEDPEFIGITFTGNANLDFAASSNIHLDPGNFLPNQTYEPTDVPTPLPQRSGFDMRSIAWEYDTLTDTMYIGIDCYGVCGDADGDGFPDSASTLFSDTYGGKDSPALGYGEYLLILIDPASSGTDYNDTYFMPNISIGSRSQPSTSLGYSTFQISGVNDPSTISSVLAHSSSGIRASYLVTPLSNETPASIVGLLDPSVRLESRSNDPSVGDIELAIRKFTTIPGINWHPNDNDSEQGKPGYGKLSFSFSVVLGSNVSSTIGTDYIPEPEDGRLTSQLLVFECPWLPLDPFGSCCPKSQRDVCGVCNGNNQYLDPCGVCRTNASLIPPSSCPGAVSDFSSFQLGLLGSQYADITQFSIATINITENTHAQLVIGIPSHNKVFIVFFESDGEYDFHTTISPSSYGPDDQFGFSVTVIGDINRDGVPDLAVGAPGFNQTGAVHIVLLKSDGTAKALRSIVPTPSLLKPKKDDYEYSSVDHISETYSPTPTYTNTQPAANLPRFGSSITILSSHSIIVTAPGAPVRNTSVLPTNWNQTGGIFLVALASDGNMIGITALTCFLTDSSLAGIDGSITGLKSAIIGKQTKNIGSTSNTLQLAIDVELKMQGEQNRTIVLIWNLRISDGYLLNSKLLKLANARFTIPTYPWSSLLNTTLWKPNQLPSDIFNTLWTISGIGDVNGDGNGDLVIGIPETSDLPNGIIVVCYLNSSGAVIGGNVIGAGGISHLSPRLSSSYKFAHTLSASTAKGTLLNLPSNSTLNFLASVTSPQNPSFIVALKLWGSAAVIATPPSSTAPMLPSSPAPPGIERLFSIVEPSSKYPAATFMETSPVQVEHLDSGPSQVVKDMESDCWIQLALSSISERGSNMPINSVPEQQLFFPSSWTKQIINANVTSFEGYMLNSSGAATTVFIQVQSMLFEADRVVVFNNVTYFGVSKHTSKFSLLLRGWPFRAPNNVLDITMNISTASPIISVTKPYDPVQRMTRFALRSTRSTVYVGVAQFASVDGIISTIPAPSFIQSSSQFIFTMPPFVDTLIYDPDVSIMTSHSDRITRGQNGTRLPFILYIAVPSAVGLLIIVFVIVLVSTRKCQRVREEKKWKEAAVL